MEQAEPYVQANVNGDLRDAREPAISPLDRGYLYGDAVYEVWRTYEGVAFAFEDHWRRLERSAAGLGMELPFGQDEGFRQARRAVAAWRERTGSDAEVYIRLQVSRGSGPIGLDTALADAPAFVCLVKEQPDLSEAELDRGFKLAVVRSLKRNSAEALPPALKTGNYLNNILGLREAREAGAGEAVFLNAAGNVAEASTRNVWAVLPERVATPPAADGLLEGVTRRRLLEEIGAIAGRPLVEAALRVEDLQAAEELFLSSTTQDVLPVSSLDGKIYPTGPDTVTRRLKTAFRALARQYAAKRPHFRV